MTLKRTPDEIVARIEVVKSDDWLGTQQVDLIHYLPFDAAKRFLKEGVTKAEWDSRGVTSPMQEACEYMEFAWGKANNCRGISAGRSVDHFRSWLWLMGTDGFDKISTDEYEFYGKPVLVIAATLLGVDWRKLDDGDWTNDGEGGTGPQDEELARLVGIGEALKQQLSA